MNTFTKLTAIAVGAFLTALPFSIAAAPDSAQQAIIQKA